MALMMGAFYDALINAGASEAKARAAAEEAAGTTEEFATVRRDIDVLGADLRFELKGVMTEVQTLRLELRSEGQADKAELQKDAQDLKGQLATLRWMMGFVLAFLVTIVFMLFRLMPHS